MNTSKGSFKNRPSIVTKASSNIPSSFKAISKVDDDAEEDRDYQEFSKRSMCKRLFFVLQSDTRLINMH